MKNMKTTKKYEIGGVGVMMNRDNGRRRGPNLTLEIRKRLKGSTDSRSTFPPALRAAIVALGDIVTERAHGKRDDARAKDACQSFDSALRAAGLRLHPVTSGQLRDPDRWRKPS